MKTWSGYHAAICSVCKSVTKIVNNQLASAMIENREWHFRSEVKSCAVSS